jgi:hypothetical protein
MRIRSLFLAACALAVLGQTPARAQLLAECRGDVQRFCTGVPLFGGRIAQCLEQNADKLSAGCKKAIASRAPNQPAGAADGATGGAGAGAAAGGPQTACRGDAMRLCPDAIGDQPKMKRCMQTHAAQLSDACKTALIAAGS